LGLKEKVQERQPVKTIVPISQQAGPTKRGVVLLADGFQDAEAIYPYYRLIEAGIMTDFAGASVKEYVGKHGYHLKANLEFGKLNSNDLDVVIIPGGFAAEKLRQDQQVLGFLREMDRRGKVIGSICHGGWVISSSGIAKGRRATCYAGISEDLINAGIRYIDRPVVADENLISSRKPEDLPDFMRAVLERMGK
jgi:protease I